MNIGYENDLIALEYRQSIYKTENYLEKTQTY